jgi:hypothetical protein
MKSQYPSQRSNARPAVRGAGKRPRANTAALALAALLAIPVSASATHRSFQAPPINWTGGPFYGQYGTFFVDVDGDGKADAVGVNADRVYWRPSNGCAFEVHRPLTQTPFIGNLGTYMADVTGDKKADLIANNNNGVIVRRSEDGRRMTWFNGPLNQNVVFADVNGDGKADAIEMEPDRITVLRSNGVDAFTSRDNWTWSWPLGQYGTQGTYFADVDGDKRADAIFVNDWGIVVRRSIKSSNLGEQFFPDETWSDYPYYGQIMNAFVDATGDGKADAIGVNYEGTAVRDSDGFRFRGLDGNNNVTDGDGPIRKWGYWTLEGFYGSRLTTFADVDGDKAADAIAVNDDGVWIRHANFKTYLRRGCGD